MKNFLLSFICLTVLCSVISTSISAQETLNDEWISEFNKDKLYASIMKTYHPKGGVDYGDGFFYSVNDIFSYLINLKSDLGSISEMTTLKQFKTSRGHQLLIQKMVSTKEVDPYYSITAFRNTDGQMLKEFELIRKGQENQKYSLAGIDEQRNHWVEFSNDHDPESLLNNVYANESLYYNNGKLSRGREAIVKRYGYMTNERWKISLTPEAIQRVNETIVFEIGTYQSTGTGTYVLIWEKNEAGKWEVYLDFNF